MNGLTSESRGAGVTARSAGVGRRLAPSWEGSGKTSDPSSSVALFGPREVPEVADFVGPGSTLETGAGSRCGVDHLGRSQSGSVWASLDMTDPADHD